MSIIATAVKHLIAAGIGGDDLVRAVAEMEAAMPIAIDTVAEKRRAYDRERKRKAKENSTGIPPESVETTGIDEILEKKSPQTPIRKIHKTPSPKGEAPLSEIETAIADWNGLAGELGLSPVRRLSADRHAKLKRRLAEHGLPGWREALVKIRGSPFCRGENDRGWTAGIDFMLSETSFLKLLEGNYDARGGSLDRRSGADRRNPAFDMFDEARAEVAALLGDQGGDSGPFPALLAPVEYDS